MSIFDRIKHAIFGDAQAAPVPQSSAGGTTAPAPTPSVQRQSTPAPTAGSSSPSVGAEPAAAPSFDASRPQTDAMPRATVDIEPSEQGVIKMHDRKGYTNIDELQADDQLSPAPTTGEEEAPSPRRHLAVQTMMSAFRDRRRPNE